MSNDQRCSEMVWSGFHTHQCDRRGSVIRDGKPYCGQHDPEKRKVVRDARQRKCDAEGAFRKARADLIRAARTAIQDERVPEALTDAVAEFEKAEAECQACNISMWKLY